MEKFLQISETGSHRPYALTDQKHQYTQAYIETSKLKIYNVDQFLALCLQLLSPSLTTQITTNTLHSSVMFLSSHNIALHNTNYCIRHIFILSPLVLVVLIMHEYNKK